MTDPLDSPHRIQLVAVGLAAGAFSGLFGIGGGVLVVPALVILIGMDHRRAVGTSLVAIIPAALASLISYGLQGSINVTAGGELAFGAILGTRIGAFAMDKLSLRAAQWAFIAFVAVMIVQLLIVVPYRNDMVEMTLSVAFALAGLGVIAGFASTILGVGGGGIVVPVMMVFFGMSDVVAKGASLFMMIPGTGFALLANAQRKMVDWRAGLVIGGAAVLTGPLGSWAAHLIPPRIGAWLFAAFLAVVGYSMVRQALRSES